VRAVHRFGALALAVVVLASACDTTDNKMTPRTFSGWGVSFGYPRSWHSAPETCPRALPQGAPAPIVFLSNQSLRTRPGPDCSGPLIGGLKAGGVFVTWWAQRPIVPAEAERLAPPVTSLRIDGHDVTEKVGPSQACARGETAVSAVIGASPSLYGFDACMRAPILKTTREQVHAMLASVRLGSQPANQ
jgi:hypothetical protein